MTGNHTPTMLVFDGSLCVDTVSPRLARLAVLALDLSKNEEASPAIRSFLLEGEVIPGIKGGNLEGNVPLQELLRRRGAEGEGDGDPHCEKWKDVVLSLRGVVRPDGSIGVVAGNRVVSLPPHAAVVEVKARGEEGIPPPPSTVLVPM